MSIQRFEPNGKRLSHVLVHKGIAYVTGQVAADRTQDVAGQTAQVLARMDELLAKAGTDKSKILFAQVWLKHVVADFAPMNAVWENWIPEDALPTRATVEANLAAENILVEIAVQAAVGD
ncbi:enamine deaminase RidA (YjgF/YER057c/UK114 family) [Sinorhizobium kostiense]|uniref:Enamine deaminase RidA (YjgF/YER057c/UK114 family) n=1 Tax=Sinorhizobium kostiense TaxID=76747 RepID=A0ABS4QUR5_9HYPH|nr:RidA family protein [Sinorhizobium kostiense]MBP2234376.1 enamine deaminase RidA (YjgF/YER057c/UK114 family) [Sinorhizobium kostiense]